MSAAKSGSSRSALEAEPLELAFPGGAWERVGAAGQVIQDIYAKNAITSSTYDARGFSSGISTTDRINATTTFAYDAAGRIEKLSMTDAENFSL